MKSFKSCLLAGVASLMVLMSSCLNGDNSTTSTVIGVVGFSADAGRNLLQTEGGNLYFQGLEDITQYPEGSCWAVNVKINSEEQTSTKFTIGVLQAAALPFDVNRNVMSLTDGEIKLEENEKPIEAVSQPLYGYNIVTKDRLFLQSLHKNNTNQLNTLMLYLDPNQEPEKLSEGGVECNMYTAYMRSFCSNAGDSNSQKNEIKSTAFDLSYLGSTLKQKEKADKKTMFAIQIKYIKSIKEDGTFELSEASESSKAFCYTGYTPETTN